MLREVGMLRPLPMPAIENLAVHVGHVNVDEGREVFRQGDSGDTFYVIKDGKAEIIDRDRHVSTIGPGTASARSLSSATVRAPPQCGARTGLLLYTLERRHFVAAVSGYPSSSREADQLIDDRLDMLSQARG